MMIHIKVK